LLTLHFGIDGSATIRWVDNVGCKKYRKIARQMTTAEIEPALIRLDRSAPALAEPRARVYLSRGFFAEG
jgi:sarcosine oxidase delta subunit